MKSDEKGNFVSEDFKHGKNFKIGYNCIIHPDVVVGDDVELKSSVELRPGTRIGNNCYVDSGVKSSGLNKIGNDVTLRYDCIIARGCDIGDGSYICPQVMTNNLNTKREQVGGARVGAGCFIGTQTVMGAGISVVDGTIIGSCAFVPKSIEEKGIYVGVPVKKMGQLGI